MKELKKPFFIVLLILLAVLSRIVPHPLNFTPIAAIALFATVYFNTALAGAFISFIILLCSDIILGFHNTMIWVYGSFALISVVGIWLRAHLGVATVYLSSVIGSVLFFIVTNFGVWVQSGMYNRTWSGFVMCYTAAIPFFGNTLMGDVFYVTLLFGSFELVRKKVLSLA